MDFYGNLYATDLLCRNDRPPKADAAVAYFSVPLSVNQNYSPASESGKTR